MRPGVLLNGDARLDPWAQQVLEQLQIVAESDRIAFQRRAQGLLEPLAEGGVLKSAGDPPLGAQYVDLGR
jgi:hypothetical protein